MIIELFIIYTLFISISVLMSTTWAIVYILIVFSVFTYALVDGLKLGA